VLGWFALYDVHFIPAHRLASRAVRLNRRGARALGGPIFKIPSFIVPCRMRCSKRDVACGAGRPVGRPVLADPFRNYLSGFIQDFVRAPARLYPTSI